MLVSKHLCYDVVTLLYCSVSESNLIDIPGGTNSDSVLMILDPVKILASHKAPTTPDVTTGINEAIKAVVNSSGVSLDDIGCVIIGTTHFVNAVVQRSPDLERVAVVRLCGGSTE
jgi:N-methylhydantoinase A/oxoprolinase/acetone carboxylase beta subunit